MIAHGHMVLVGRTYAVVWVFDGVMLYLDHVTGKAKPTHRRKVRA